MCQYVAMKDYVAHLDNKKNYAQRAAYQYYNVKEYEMAALFWNLETGGAEAFQPELRVIWIVQW